MVENEPELPPGAEDEARFIASIKRLREEREWSQGELARRMVELGWKGFHQTTVSRIEKGERPLRYGEAMAFAEVFGVPEFRFVATDDELKYTQSTERLQALEKELGALVDRYINEQEHLAVMVDRLRETLDPTEEGMATYAVLRTPAHIAQDLQSQRIRERQAMYEGLRHDAFEHESADNEELKRYWQLPASERNLSRFLRTQRGFYQETR